MSDGFFFWCGEFFDVPAFKQERGVGPMADSFPDFELALTDPAQKSLARDAESPTRFGAIQYHIRIHNITKLNITRGI